MTVIMTPIEIIGKFTKPFALAIRLFANMTAGHVVLLALISLIFTFGSYWIVLPPLLMGVAISMLELFVALLAGVHLHAALQRIHRVDPRGCALAATLIARIRLRAMLRVRRRTRSSDRGSSLGPGPR